MKTYIGVDLGGTNVRVAKISEDGTVLEQLKSPSYAQEGREKVMENLIGLIHKIPDWQSCAGIGVGVPGPCNQETGSMSMSTNLPGFTGFPFVDTLQKEFGIPAFIDNDANVAGLAEALLGAGKGLPVVYYVTLSTGIGGGLVVNGMTVSGKHGYAGEIAGIVVRRESPKYNHLAPGAVENEASGTAVTRKANERIPDMHFEHAGQVFELAEAGNETARQIVAEVVQDLGQLFATLSDVLDPDMFVIGGGMMKSADKFMPQVIEEFNKLVQEPMRDVVFAKAELEEPGIIGAAMLPYSHGC